MRAAPPPSLSELPRLIGLSVSRETWERLVLFAELVLRWNAGVRLIARADEPKLWSRHILDSLQLLPLILPYTKGVIDLGSGAGFPGIVLAIAGAPSVTLVEADERKAAFLREAARRTSTPVVVHAGRIEHFHRVQWDIVPTLPFEVAKGPQTTADTRRFDAATLANPIAVTARGLAALSALLRYSYPLLRGSGYCIFPKGQQAEAELTQAEAAWHMRVERFPSRISLRSTILRISEIEPVGNHPSR